jgi:hypothetical protein
MGVMGIVQLTVCDGVFLSTCIQNMSLFNYDFSHFQMWPEIS